MTTTYTPGPWAVRWWTQNGYCEITSPLFVNLRTMPEPLARVYPGYVQKPGGEPGELCCPQDKVDECAANARLIAAAPELLAALLAVDEFFDYCSTDNYHADSKRELMDKINAAVKKALN